MSNRSLIGQMIALILYVLGQVTLGSQFILFDRAFTLLYVGFLLMLPLDSGPLLLMVVGFLTGLTVDIFYDTLGINAVSALVLMYVRPRIIALLTPQGGIEPGATPSMVNMGTTWFSTYVLFSLLVYNLVLFFLEASSFRPFFYIMGNVLASTILTYLVLVIIQLAFYRKKTV